jgi:(1->4)-alpha-D-glucan 1-alpha-D-glucosylmutase
MANPREDRVKLYASSALLRFRRSRLDLFQRGDYRALASAGARREHVFAFARTHGTRTVAVAVPRLIATLLADRDSLPIGEHVWGDTTFDAPAGGPASYRHVLTGATICAREGDKGRQFRAAEVFAGFPIAFLESR